MKFQISTKELYTIMVINCQYIIRASESSQAKPYKSCYKIKNAVQHVPQKGAAV